MATSHVQLPLISSKDNHKPLPVLNPLIPSYQSKPQLQRGFQLPQQEGTYYNQPHNAWNLDIYNTNSGTPSSPFQLKTNTELLELCYQNGTYPRKTPYIIPKEDNYGRLPSLLAHPKASQNTTQILRITEPTLNGRNHEFPIGSYDVSNNLYTNIPMKVPPLHSTFTNIHPVLHGLNSRNVTDKLDDNLKLETTKPFMWNIDVRQNIPLDSKVSYSKLIPLIKRTKPNNINELFVATLLECSHHVPLDDFFILLFNEVTPESVSPIPIGGKVDKSPYTYFKNEALTLCYHILETFRKRHYNSPDYPIKLVHNPLLFKMKLFEVRRTFLAIKILFDTFTEVQGPSWHSSTISRPSIQKAYHFICKNLLEKYSTSSKLLPSSERVEVCSSRLGRMTKLVYSRLSLRRLGKRGDSVYHYVGLTWNKNIVDDEIVRAIEDQSCKSIN